MSQEVADMFEPPPKRCRQAFHNVTDEQLSINVMGTQRIFKKGESFSSDEWAGRLCRHNKNVPPYVRGAVFTIGMFYPGMAKKAECAVRIPLWDAFIHEEVRLRIQQQYPKAEFITLPLSERIELRKLHHPVAMKRLSDGKLIWNVIKATCTRSSLSLFPPRRLYSFTLLHEMNVKMPTVLELFAGAGGMSTGFSGVFDVRWLVQNDPFAAATLKLNHQKGDARVFQEDVEIFLKKAEEGRPGYPKKGQVHHIHASPPCQGFSKANRNGGKNDFQNNAKTFLLIDAIQHFQPEMASFENVTGMLDAEGMLGNETVHYWEKLLSMLLLDTAYHFRAGILKASDYGDPQNRKRLFIVAAKRGRNSQTSQSLPMEEKICQPNSTSKMYSWTWLQ